MNTVQGFFGPRTDPEEKKTKKVAKCVRKDLLSKEKLAGYVYIAKQTDTGFCKVGWSKNDYARRIKAIRKCQIVICSSYQIGRFVGAYRAEQLVHKLLCHRRHLRKNCSCGCRQNREWYKIDYPELIYQVLIVFSWLRVDPYNTVAKKYKLKPIWEDALKRWESAQDTKYPLEWDDFFVNGPSLETVVGGPRHNSPPQPLPSGQQRNTTYINRIVFQLGRSPMKGNLRNPLRQVQQHLTNHGRGKVSDRRTSKLRSSLKEEAALETFRDWETVDEALVPTSSKLPQARRESTWDHWFMARDKQIPDTTVSETVAHSEQSDFTDNLCASPYGYCAEVSESTWLTAFADQPQQSLPLALARDISESSSGYLKGYTDGASYHLLATIDSPDMGSTSEVEKNWAAAGQRGNSPSRSENALLDIAIMLARMPGTFPDEEIEEASSVILNVNEAQKRSSLSPRNTWFGGTPEQGNLIAESAQGTNVSIMRNAVSAAEVSNVTPIVYELDSRAAPSTSSETTHVTIPDVRLASTSEVGNLKAAPQSTTDSASQDKNVANKATAAGLEVHLPSVEHPTVPMGGTAGFPFRPVVEKGPDFENTYQSISCMLWYSKCSFEELRLKDYIAGHRFAYEDTAELPEEFPDCETASSLSDDDRPWTKQQALEKELQDLLAEHMEFEGLGPDTMEYKRAKHRLKRLRRNMEAMDTRPTDEEVEKSIEEETKESSQHSTEDYRFPTFDEWSDQPSEDDSADGAWASDTDNANVDTQDDEEASTQEVSSKVDSSALPAKLCSDFSEAATPTLDIAETAETHAPAGISPSEGLGAFKFQFCSPASNVNMPRFNFTQPFETKETSVVVSKIFTDVFVKSRSDVPSCNCKSASVGSLSPNNPEPEQDNEANNDMLFDKDSNDNTGRPQASNERLKRAKHTDSPISLAEQPVRETNQCDSGSESQPYDRSVTGRPLLAIKNEPQQGDSDEIYDADVSDMGEDMANKHIPSPAIAWGTDGRLGLRAFREKDFLSQKWSFDVG